MANKVIGIGTFNAKLDNLTRDVQYIIDCALYDAAGMVADAVKKELEAMHTHAEGYTAKGQKRIGATESEKRQIIQNMGISKFRNSQTSIGFTGYVHTISNKFGDNVPTGMLMQCIEYGTDFRQPTHTISKAYNSVRDKCVEIAQNRIDQEVNKIMN